MMAWWFPTDFTFVDGQTVTITDNRPGSYPDGNDRLIDISKLVLADAS